MRPVQEAFIELLAEGLSRSAACRRLGVPYSSPRDWSKASSEFAEALRPYITNIHKCHATVDVVKELAEFLIAQGYADAEVSELTSRLASFFVSVRLISYKDASSVIDREPIPEAERRRLVDAYIELKKTRAGTNRALSAFLAEHRVSQSQMQRWARRFYGRGALLVGPYQRGHTRSLVFEAVQAEHQVSARRVAAKLDIPFNSVREYLRQLAKDGRLKKITLAGKVYYARA